MGADWPRRVLLAGDVREQLQHIPDELIDCVVTSPPYFRLRDYGVDGQLGLESHVERWVDHLAVVMEDVRRVLVATGTVWLNLGDSYSTHQREGAPRKSLVAAPERLLLRLLADGWIVRNKIVWAKTNHAPTSVSDRLACGYELIYLLAKSSSYYFDLDDIRQPHRSCKRTAHRRAGADGSRRPPGRRSDHSPSGALRARSSWRLTGTDHDGGLLAMRRAGVVGHPLGKNPGDVWALATSNFRGAHFATYPEPLVERMLRAGCPELRCRACRAAWRRPVRRIGTVATRLALAPGCGCQAPAEPGLVLDPFMGSGTTAVLAERLQRDWVGIELNPEYRKMARQRIQDKRRERAR